jgi:hypothetical protein
MALGFYFYFFDHHRKNKLKGFGKKKARWNQRCRENDYERKIKIKVENKGLTRS